MDCIGAKYCQSEEFKAKLLALPPNSPRLRGAKRVALECLTLGDRRKGLKDQKLPVGEVLYCPYGGPIRSE